MTSKKMTIERLNELISAYGANPQRWPDAERDQAIAFMDANRAATEEAIKKANVLDELLESDKKNVGNTDFLAARIMKAANAENSAPPVAANDRLIPWRKSTWKSVAATFILTTGFGFAAGQSAVAKSNRMDTAEALLSISIEDASDVDNLWEDLQ